MNTFELSRVFFDYCINNPDKIKTGNIALYYFIIDHCNRLGWPDKIGLPSYYAMTVLGIARYETYKAYLQTLVDCGFVNIVELSKNQYTSTVISLNGAKLKNSKPHRTAIVEHTGEQSVSIPDSNSSIIKPKTINLKQETNIGDPVAPETLSQNEIEIPKQPKLNKEEEFNKRREEFKLQVKQFTEKYPYQMLSDFYSYWSEKKPNGYKMRFELEPVFEIDRRLKTWERKSKEFQKSELPANVGGGSMLKAL